MASTFYLKCALLLLSSAVFTVTATDHIVGANRGWNPGLNYTLWSNNHTFYVGDLICQFYIYLHTPPLSLSFSVSQFQLYYYYRSSKYIIYTQSYICYALRFHLTSDLKQTYFLLFLVCPTFNQIGFNSNTCHFHFQVFFIFFG